LVVVVENDPVKNEPVSDMVVPYEVVRPSSKPLTVELAPPVTSILPFKTVEKDSNEEAAPVDTVGATELFTMTVILFETVEFPAPSVATAVSVCDPSSTVAESQVILYGEVVPLDPIFVPSILN
jgi:hypothetical protein